MGWKEPQCQVRTLDWGLVRWDPLTFRKEGGMSGLDLETASPSVMKVDLKMEETGKGQRGCPRVQTGDYSPSPFISCFLEGFGVPGDPRSTWAHQPEDVCIGGSMLV